MKTLAIFICGLGLSIVANAQQFGSSCVGDICIGQHVYNIQRDYREVEVVGFENSGTFVLRFLDNGGIGGNWSRADLAVMNGCSGRLCVGNTAYNIQRDYRFVSIVGIQYDGRYVLRFQDNGGVGGNWNDADLAIPSGCGNVFCVGDMALNNKRNYRQVQVVAIQSDRRYVVKFLDNGGVGGNWSDDDLVRTGGQPAPYPGPQPIPDYSVSGQGINMTESPNTACRIRYGTYALIVIARGQRFTCTVETCDHPYDWSEAFCARP